MIVSEKEITRQFRVLLQTLGIHSILRDRYLRLSRMAEIILLGCSVIFCATTFAGEQLYIDLGLSPSLSKTILGIASVCAFFVSLVLLVVNSCFAP